MTLFINSNINISISVDWVVKTSCLFYFRSKVSLCQRNTHDAGNLLANVAENFCSISAQKTTKQIFVKTDLLTIWKHRVGLDSARATLCKWATRTRQTCFSKTFANSQMSGNNKKLSNIPVYFSARIISALPENFQKFLELGGWTAGPCCPSPYAYDLSYLSLHLKGKKNDRCDRSLRIPWSK